MTSNTHNLKREDDIYFLNEKNTKSYLEQFGEVELKYISFGDIDFFVELSNEIDDDKEFSIQVLYHQLIQPDMSSSDFNKISNDGLIKLAKDFINGEPLIFEYFKETTEDEFFADFREAIRSYHQMKVEKLEAAFLPIIKSTKNILKTFNMQYSNLIYQTIKSTSYLTESLKKIDLISKQFQNSQLLIAESLGPIIEQSNQTARILSEVLTPQINFWQNWLNTNKLIFNCYDDFWRNFHQQYKITEQEAIQILKKYKWFITLSLPLDFVYNVVKIGRKRGNQRKNINKLFVDYFCLNNFENLENLVEEWDNISIFKPRMKIFKDCISILKNSKRKTNPSNLLVPTLIAQIDGIQTEFMELNGLYFNPKVRKWKDKGGNVVYPKQWFKAQTSNQELLDLSNHIFLNILFQKSDRGEPLGTPFTFSRHKIMHGEYVNYGRIDNTIRAFMILDFLATLTNRTLQMPRI
jgi:hypothetical protein